MGNLNVRNPEIRNPFIEPGRGGGVLHTCCGLKAEESGAPPEDVLSIKY
jgi:hypothetical protein